MCANTFLTNEITVWMNDFILNAVSLPWLKYVMTFHLEMYKGQGSKAVHKKVHLGQRMLFFSECKGNVQYPTMRYKILHGAYLVSKPKVTNLYNFRFVPI